MHRPSQVARSIRLGQSRTGLSQVEVAISTVIVGVLMVASFTTVAASRRSQVAESTRVRGLALAEAMMAEMMQLPMREPACDCGFGLESGESLSNRTTLDDVDDYNASIESPPIARGGTALDGSIGLSRSVLVELVQSNDWNSTTATFDGVYRITVTVNRGSTPLARLVGFRTSGSQSTSPTANLNVALN
jgi:hypothetical protein